MMIRDETGLGPNDNGKITKCVKGPKSDRDFLIFEKLCGIQCEASEISAVMGCSIDTLRARVLERYGRPLSATMLSFRGEGAVSLRRAQFAKALSGNTSMLIWLGKQVLQQADRPNEKSDGDDKKSKVANLADQEVVHGLEKRIERIQRRRAQKRPSKSGAERPAASENGPT